MRRLVGFDAALLIDEYGVLPEEDPKASLELNRRASIGRPPR